MNMRNPEFLRQIWLNWRPALLAWSLGLSLLVLALPTALSSPAHMPGALAMTALAGLWAAAVGYGSVLAGRSLLEEASQNTWDWQRLSALSPWQMGWGKLLGAVLPAWLYALWFALALAVIAAFWQATPFPVTHAIGLAVLWGLSLQAWAMNFVLVSWGHQDRPALRKRSLLPLVLLGYIVFQMLFGLYDGLRNPGSHTEYWWGLSVGTLGYSYMVGALLLGLGLLGLWRQLCTRLDVPTLPWAWPLGLVLAGGFAAGSETSRLSAFFSTTAWFAIVATAAVALLHMGQHLRAWRQVQWSLSRQRWRSALQALPLWPVSLLLALVFSLLLIVLGTPGDHNGDKLGFATLCLTLQLLRDCLVLTGFALLSGKLRSPMAAFVIAWLILNVAAPLLAYGVAGTQGAMLLQPAVALWIGSLAAPTSPNPMTWLHAGSLVLQIALALTWATMVFRDRVLGFARDNAPRPGCTF